MVGDQIRYVELDTDGVTPLVSVAFIVRVYDPDPGFVRIGVLSPNYGFQVLDAEHNATPTPGYWLTIAEAGA